MAPTEPGAAHRALLVGEDEAVRAMMSVTDVLVTDLQMPNPSDGFALVTAMRHFQPDALTLLVSGYPDVKSTMDAIPLEADDIIAKPFEAGKLAEMVHEKLLTRKPFARMQMERVAAILLRCTSGIAEDWLARAKQSADLSCVPLSDKERTGPLPSLVEDLALRLSKPSDAAKDSHAIFSPGRHSPWGASCGISKATHARHAGA